jgi:hypothetical protein
VEHQSPAGSGKLDKSCYERLVFGANHLKGCPPARSYAKQVCLFSPVSHIENRREATMLCLQMTILLRDVGKATPGRARVQFQPPHWTPCSLAQRGIGVEGGSAAPCAEIRLAACTISRKVAAPTARESLSLRVGPYFARTSIAAGVLLWLAGSAVLPASSSQTNTSVSKTREMLSSEVYSVAISSVTRLSDRPVFVVSETVPYSRTKSEFPVDPQRVLTESQARAEIAQASSKADRKRLLKENRCYSIPDAERDEYLSAMKDYLLANEGSTRLGTRLALPSPHVFLTEGQAAGFKGTAGLLQVSAIGFSADFRVAIVYVGFDCPLCGHWGLHVLTLQNGKWRDQPLFCPYQS